MSNRKPKRRARMAGGQRPSHRLALPDEIARLEKEFVGWTDGTYAAAEAERVRGELRERRVQMAARKVGSKDTLTSMIGVASAARGAARDAAVTMLTTLGLTQAEVLQLLDAEPAQVVNMKGKKAAPTAQADAFAEAPAEAEPEWMQSDGIPESDELSFLDD